MNSITITNHKAFMNSLLREDKFDSFLLKEACIITSNTYTIDGRENKAFYSDIELSENISPYEYASWSRMRQVILGLIKGHNTPLKMKFVLYADPETTSELLGETAKDVDYLILNYHFDESGMGLTSAVAYKTFTLDKEADKAWDIYVAKLIDQI